MDALQFVQELELKVKSLIEKGVNVDIQDINEILENAEAMVVIKLATAKASGAHNQFQFKEAWKSIHRALYELDVAEKTG